MQRLLVIVGIASLIAALAWPLLRKLPFGRMPGDIVHRSGNVTFYFPWVTMLVVSIVISLLLWFFRK